MKTPTLGNQESRETPSLLRRDKGKKVEEAKKEPSKPLLQERHTPFDEEQVQTAWEKFKAARLEDGASDTEKLVLDRKVAKSDDTNVKIFLESQLETSILDKFEGDLVRFFKKELDNTNIKVEREVTEQESSRNLYTSREKFEYMAKLNPALREMKERLGLDFEY